MAGRPAPLEGSLLARKGDATPVIPDDSPLTESVEGATSDVVPLHRVASPDTAPPPAAAAAVFEATPVSPHRRAAIILVALLVVFLIAVALAARSHRTGPKPGPAGGTETSSVAPPVPAGNRADAVAAPVPIPPAVPEEAPPPETVATGTAATDTASIDAVPPEAASAESAPSDAAATAAAEAAEAPPPQLKKPDGVTPVPGTAKGKKLYVLQFASVRAEDRALQEAARLQKRLGGVLGDRRIVVVGTEVDGRQRYRLRAGSFDSLRAAISACRDIARLKVDCLPIRR